MTQANPSAGLVGSSPGLTDAVEHVAAPRPKLYQVWHRIRGSWICSFAAPDRDAAMTYAKGQIRHDAGSAVERIEVRALSDDGVTVLLEQ